MELNPIDSSHMLIATIFLLTLVTIHYQFSLNNIEGLGEVTTQWTRGEGLKSATMFKISNQDGELGSISKEDACSLNIGKELAAEYDKNSCGNSLVSNPVHGSTIRISEDKKSTLSAFWVSGAK
ncbi:hypothetical protein [Candidatus Nanohalobium constans]|uniref:Uncharacterized protein n=1 Tax=Candidatus Nanohalobium constans TaxID=2565781 RepID=A0A5Q0UI14_9ARCH|nr:hypothetical protein [Candidatus Nanohalobium constans]QGA80830.1 hypothetical protein LC1Nh_0948 [Candidatus Nanohalobium constans]